MTLVCNQSLWVVFPGYFQLLETANLRVENVKTPHRPRRVYADTPAPDTDEDMDPQPSTSTPCRSEASTD